MRREETPLTAAPISATVSKRTKTGQFARANAAKPEGGGGGAGGVFAATVATRLFWRGDGARRAIDDDDGALALDEESAEASHRVVVEDAARRAVRKDRRSPRERGRAGTEANIGSSERAIERASERSMR